MEGKTLYQNLTIDDATREEIFDWFQYREIVDDEKFRTFFRRKMSLYLSRYDDLVRVDLTKIDPLVSSYRERELIHKGDVTGTGSDTTENKKTGSDSNTVTHSGRDTYYNESTPGVSTTVTNTGTQGTQRMEKLNPQSISYSGGGVGMPDNFDWSYSTNQSEDKRKDDLSQVTTRTGSDENNSYTEYGHTVTTTTKPGVTDTSTVTKGSGQKYDLTDHEIWTGRDGLTPQEALMKMREYLRETNALQWLLRQLEPCFLAIYEI